MQSVTAFELDTVAGGLGFAILSPITIGASNTATVIAPQGNLNVAGLANQGGNVTVAQGISISL